jgi:hydrogenase expression/formation protein HypE
MTTPPTSPVPGSAAAFGKLAPGALERLILPHLGAQRPEVLVGPRPGHDAAILKVGAGRVIAVTTDPLSIVPALGLQRSARLCCHLLASDLWTSGIPPAFASVCLDLPPSLGDTELETFLRAMSAEWSKLEVAVVAGHTGRYPGKGESTIVGAATLIGLGDEGRYVTPAMASPGDRVIVTKGCAIEATAIAAFQIPERLGPLLEEDGLERARDWIDQVSVVDDCRALIQIGVHERGVTALHDATEGGVLGGLLELARASGHDLRIMRERIPLDPKAKAACEAWGGIDPYWTLGEGALIATVRPQRLEAALAALVEAKIPAAEVGEVVRGSGTMWLTEPDDHVTSIKEPVPDPYWPAYDRAVREAWR